MAKSTSLARALEDAQAGRLEAALAAVRLHMRRYPQDGEAIAILGLLLVQSGEVEQAIHHLGRAAKLAPTLPGPRNNLANALFQADRFADAEREWLAAAELDPTYARAWLGLVTCRTSLEDSAGALDAARKARALRPEWTELDRSEAAALAAADRMEDSVRVLEQAVARDPGSAALRGSLLMQLNFLDRPAREVAEAHRAYAACVRVAPSPPPIDRDPERPLRLGVLSGDLRSHSVASFADPIFRHLPPGWHLTAFSTSRPTPGDPLAAEFRRLAGDWCDLAAASDEVIERKIREHRIDVLIELSGHSATGRLAVLDRKPAPVVATAIGYPNTTGHPSVDLRIVDSITDPPGSETLATERLVRIDPCFLAYRPPADAPEPAMPDPASPITFGSFNFLAKISASTLAFWRTTLDACPGSRLLLKSRSLGDPSASARLLERAAAAGIARDRIEILPFTKGVPEHLALYRRVHLALDAVPYNGTTTTCEALWMGVPLVTVLGDRHAARVGASLLHAAGLSELVGATQEEAARIAASLAADRARLGELRAGLRGRLRTSPLLDGAAWASRFHGALREAWRRRCGS